MNSERRLDVRHVVLESRRDHLVVAKAGIGEALPRAGAQPMKGELLDLGGKLRIIGCDRPALDGRDVLRDIEGKAGQVAVRADPRATPLGAEGVRGVLDFLVFGSPLIEQAAIDEVVDSLRSGWIGTGPKVH